MPKVNVEDIYPGAWGILAECREEVENSACGMIAEIFKKQIAKHFINFNELDFIARKAGLADGGKMGKGAIRFISHEGALMYYKPDVYGAIRAFSAEKAAHDEANRRALQSEGVTRHYNKIKGKKFRKAL